MVYLRDFLRYIATYISSEDSDSPAVYEDLFPSSGVPSGIVL